VKPVKSGLALSFNLSTASELNAFQKAATQELQNAEWSARTAHRDSEIDDELD